MGRRGECSLAIGLVGLPLMTLLSGCVFDPLPARMFVANESDVTLRIVLKGSPRSTLEPGVTTAVPLQGSSDACTEWELQAITANATVVATVGPPVCGGQEWVITQDDVDQHS